MSGVSVCLSLARKITIQRELSTGHTYAFRVQIKDCNQRKCLVVDKKLIAQLAIAKIEFGCLTFAHQLTHTLAHSLSFFFLRQSFSVY